MRTPEANWARVPLRAVGSTAAAFPGRLARGGGRVRRALSASAAGAREWPAVVAGSGEQVRSAVLPVTDLSCGERVSALIGKALASWHLADMCDDVELCARELTANVARHTAGPDLTALVTLRWQPGARLRLEVSDRCEQMPVLRRPVDVESLEWLDLPGGTAGRGLSMVSRYSDVLSWAPLPGGGKTVWCAWLFNGADEPGSVW